MVVSDAFQGPSLTALATGAEGGREDAGKPKLAALTGVSPIGTRDSGSRHHVGGEVAIWVPKRCLIDQGCIISNT